MFDLIKNSKKFAHSKRYERILIYQTNYIDSAFTSKIKIFEQIK